MIKVLVTGASGFIGRQVLPRLVKQGLEVHALSSKTKLPSDKTIQWHHCDLFNTSQVTSLFHQLKPRYLLHLAWVTEHGIYWQSAENYCWVQASLYLLNCFQKNGGERVVSAGSCAEYDWRYGYCVEDVTPCLADNAYASCKISMQSLQQAFAETHQLSQAWGRIFFLFGSDESPRRLVPYIVNTLLQRQIVTCNDDCLLRDFLYVEDAADAFVTLLTSEVQGIVNIASGQPLAIGELTVKIADSLGQYNKNMIHFNYHKSEASMVVANTQKLSEQVNWKPSYSFDEALDKTINWWRHNNEY